MFCLVSSSPGMTGLARDHSIYSIGQASANARDLLVVPRRVHAIRQQYDVNVVRRIYDQRRAGESGVTVGTARDRAAARPRAGGRELHAREGRFLPAEAAVGEGGIVV